MQSSPALRTPSLCLLSLVLVTGGCGSSEAPGDSATFTLGAYTAPREAYAAILPSFRDQWQERSREPLEARESYLGSGAQSRAIVSGFEADVAALSLEPDIQTLVDAGLVRPDWNAGPHRGMVTRSVVVIGVREGNPENIHDWADLARPGLEILTPNVRTSGGAMWNVLAIHGAALRASDGGTREASVARLASVLRNVRTMDRGARESLLSFERGEGDVIITYENELLVGRAGGQRYEIVLPSSTVLIENPVAVVDGYVDRHGTREVAEAFVAHLRAPAAQRIYAAHGLRPVLDEVAREVASDFGVVEDLFTVDDLGGWGAVRAEVFDPGGVYDRALRRSREPVQ